MDKYSYLDFQKIQKEIADQRRKNEIQRDLAKALLALGENNIGIELDESFRKEVREKIYEVFAGRNDAQLDFVAPLKVKGHSEPRGLYVSYQYRVMRREIWEQSFVLFSTENHVNNEDIAKVREVLKAAEAWLFYTNVSDQLLKKYVVQYNKGVDLINDALEKLGPHVSELLQ